MRGLEGNPRAASSGVAGSATSNGAREARSANPFCFGFQGKTSLFITGHARRAGCLSYFLSMFVSINIVINLFGRQRSTQTARIPDPLRSVRTQTISKPSRAGHAEIVQSWSSQARKRVFVGPWLGRV